MISIKKSIVLLGILCFTLLKTGLGQTVIAPSPAAQNMADATSGISYYTGALNYSIPIFTIRDGNITVPISLTYAGTGIKVNDAASWCGLGWTLNTGGILTRTVVGLPDETPNTGYNNYIAKGKLAISTTGNPTLTNSHQIDSLANGIIDGEPDIFQFSFPGGSGKLIRSSGNSFIPLPYQHVFPTYGPFLLDSSAPNLLFTDDCMYNFSIPASTTTTLRSTYFFPGTEKEYHMDSIAYSTNAWYLSQIISLQGNVIGFNYDNFYDSVASPDYRWTFFRPVTGSDNLFETPSNLSTIQYTYAPHVKEIDFASGKVLFISKQQYYSSGGLMRNSFALDKIIIQDTAQHIIKQFKFDYAYWPGNGNQLIPYDSISGAGRLILTGMKELDSSGTPVNSGYRFSYNLNNNFPPIGITGAASSIPDYTDYWGYFNNLEHNAHYDYSLGRNVNGLGYDLISNPWYPAYAPSPNQNNPLKSLSQIIDLSCLEPNGNATAGSLATIYMPTGLKEDISYENNYGVYPSSLAPTVPSVGPGIRVSNILVTDSAAHRQESTSFVYSNGFGASPPVNRGTFTIYNPNISANQQYETLSLGEYAINDESIGYGQVEVDHYAGYGDDYPTIPISREVYHFANPSDQVPLSSGYQDQIPLVVNDTYSGYAFNAPHNERLKWLQGCLLAQESYIMDSVAGNMVLKKRTTSSYGYPLSGPSGGILYPNSGTNSVQLLPAVRVSPFADITNLSNRKSYSIYYGYAGISNPVSSSNITYENNDSLTVSESFTYNGGVGKSSGPLNTFSIHKTFPDSTKTGEIFYYCDQFFGMANKTLLSTCPLATGHFITSKIAEHVTTRTVNSNEYVVGGEQFRYTGDGDIDSMYILQNVHIPVQNFEFANFLTPYIHVDPHYVLAKKMRWNLRRNSGNYNNVAYQWASGLDGLSESIDLTTGDTTAYVSMLPRFQGTFLDGSGGSSDGYPSAVIKGASFSKAMSYLTPSGWTSDSAFNADINHLRISLPQASISSVIYRPVVGQTTITDPTGNMIYIDYDKDARPIDKKDKNKNILEKTEYHNK